MTEVELKDKLSFLINCKKLGNLEIIDYPERNFAKIFFFLDREPWIVEYFYNEGIVHTKVTKNNGYEENVTGDLDKFAEYISGLS